MMRGLEKLRWHCNGLHSLIHTSVQSCLKESGRSHRVKYNESLIAHCLQPDGPVWHVDNSPRLRIYSHWDHYAWKCMHSLYCRHFGSINHLLNGIHYIIYYIIYIIVYYIRCSRLYHKQPVVVNSRMYGLSATSTPVGWTGHRVPP